MTRTANLRLENPRVRTRITRMAKVARIDTFGHFWSLSVIPLPT